MATAASTFHTQPRIQAQSTCAPEDTLALKIVTAIPLVGIITSLFANMRLNARVLEEATDSVTPAKLQKIIHLIDSKNHYEYANLARHLVCVALIVTGVAMGTLTFGVSLGISLALWGWLIYSDVTAIQENQGVIRDLQARSLS